MRKCWKYNEFYRQDIKSCNEINLNAVQSVRKNEIILLSLLAHRLDVNYFAHFL